MRKPFLPEIAALIAEWFPELGGRALAVSEANITRENMPTLPLCMVALIASDADRWVWQSAASRTDMVEDFMVEFWLAPVKLRKADGTETPFWAFYDYEQFRDKLLSEIIRYNGPRGQRIEFVRMAIESDQFAVVLSFRFKAHFKWCANEFEAAPCEPDVARDGGPARIVTKICQPASVYCSPAFEPQEDCDPCP